MGRFWMRCVGGMRMRLAGVFWRGKERDFVRESFGFFLRCVLLSLVVWSMLDGGGCSCWCSGCGLNWVSCSILPVRFFFPCPLCFLPSVTGSLGIWSWLRILIAGGRELAMSRQKTQVSTPYHHLINLEDPYQIRLSALTLCPPYWGLQTSMTPPQYIVTQYCFTEKTATARSKGCTIVGCKSRP